MSNFIKVKDNKYTHFVNMDNVLCINESNFDDDHSLINFIDGSCMTVKGKPDALAGKITEKIQVIRAFEAVISQTNMDAGTYAGCLEKFTKLIKDETN